MPCECKERKACQMLHNISTEQEGIIEHNFEVDDCPNLEQCPVKDGIRDHRPQTPTDIRYKRDGKIVKTPKWLA